MDDVAASWRKELTDLQAAQGFSARTSAPLVGPTRATVARHGYDHRFGAPPRSNAAWNASS